jgi:hypothetical protein
MFPLVTLGTHFLYFLGSILLSGIISVSSGPQTAVNGGAIMVPDFTSAGVASHTAKIPVIEPFAAFVEGTGSTTLRYGAACFPNPLKGMNMGSGTVVRLTYHVGHNPTGIGGDIGFVKNCTNHAANDATASGAQLIDNTCTATGCTSYYTTGTAPWNNADFIKFTPRGNLTSGYTGRITGEVEDIWGE